MERRLSIFNEWSFTGVGMLADHDAYISNGLRKGCGSWILGLPAQRCRERGRSRRVLSEVAGGSGKEHGSPREAQEPQTGRASSHYRRVNRRTGRAGQKSRPERRTYFDPSRLASEAPKARFLVAGAVSLARLLNIWSRCLFTHE